MMDWKVFMAQVQQYTLKSMRRYVRNRTAIFFVFLMPVFLLLMMGWVFGGAGQTSVPTFDVAVVDLDSQPVDVNGTMLRQSYLGNVFVQVLEDVNLTVEEYDELGNATKEGTAMYALAHGNAQAVVVIPANFTECLTMRYTTRLSNGSVVPLPVSPTVVVEVDSTDQYAYQVVRQMLTGIVTGFADAYREQVMVMSGVAGTDAERFVCFIAHPIVSEVHEYSGGSQDQPWIYYMTPGVLGVVVIWSGLSSSARSLAIEREDGMLRRLMVASASPTAVLLGEYLTTFLTVVISAALALVTGVLVFQVSLNWDFVAILVLTALVSFSVIGPGLIISSFAKNAEAAGSIQTVISIVLQFFTGSFFPVFLLPPAGQVFATALPYTQYSLAATDIMTRGLTLFDVSSRVSYVTVSGIVLMFIGALSYRRALKALQ